MPTASRAKRGRLRQRHPRLLHTFLQIALATTLSVPTPLTAAEAPTRKPSVRVAPAGMVRSQFPSLSPAPLPPIETSEEPPLPAESLSTRDEAEPAAANPDAEPFSATSEQLHNAAPAELSAGAPMDDAVEVGTLSVEELQAIARGNHPAIARAQAKVSAARGLYVQAGLGPNPIVGYSGQQIGSRGLAEQDGVFVEQEIVRGGKLRLNRQVAARDVMLAERALWIVEQRVMTDVHLAYYQMAVAQRQFDLTEKLQRIAREALRSAESLYHAKEVSKPDVLQAELEVENAEILLQNARNRQQAAWRSLTTVIAQPELPPQRVTDNLNDERVEFEWESTWQNLTDRSPEIAAASAAIERARWALERARVEPRPNITVQGLVNARDNGIGGRSDGSVQVGLPVPVWNRNQGAIAAAQCELAAAIRQFEQVELDLRNRLAPVFERYSNAHNQVERYRSRILPAAQESLDLTRRSYQAGEVGFVSLLTAQRTYFQTNLSYVDAIRELRLAEAEIEGLLLTDSLSP